MTVKISPIFNDAQLDSSGNPASGYKLFTYTAGSSTKQTVYQDSAGLTQHTNPILLNSRGEPPAPIWLTSGGAYKFVYTSPTDTDPPVSPIRTVDNVSGVNDATGVFDQWVAGPTPTYISATSFSLAGDQTSTFDIGRRLKTTNTAGTVYSTITASAFGALTTVTVVNDSTTLDSGLSAVSYGLLSATNPAQPATGYDYISQGRLTLTSGTAVTTADVTAATSVLFTPFRGNKVDLYDSAKWVRYKFSELTLAVPATTVTMYDVFLKNVSGTLTLSAVAWTNDTTRATALTTQDGVLVKTGDAQSRYLGSFRTTGVSGQTEDSLVKRYVWNYYNRVARVMRAVDTADSWNYTTATFRQANANAANQLDYVQGVSEDPVRARVVAGVSNGTAGVEVQVSVGVDSTSVNAAQVVPTGRSGSAAAGVIDWTDASYVGYPGVGRHFLAWLEYSAATGTSTWIGDNATTRQQSGIFGEFNG